MTQKYEKKKKTTQETNTSRIWKIRPPCISITYSAPNSFFLQTVLGIDVLNTSLYNKDVLHMQLQCASVKQSCGQYARIYFVFSIIQLR